MFPISRDFILQWKHPSETDNEAASPQRSQHENSTLERNNSTPGLGMGLGGLASQLRSRVPRNQARESANLANPSNSAQQSSVDSSQPAEVYFSPTPISPKDITNLDQPVFVVLGRTARQPGEIFLVPPCKQTGGGLTVQKIIDALQEIDAHNNHWHKIKKESVQDGQPTGGYNLIFFHKDDVEMKTGFSHVTLNVDRNEFLHGLFLVEYGILKHANFWRPTIERPFENS